MKRTFADTAYFIALLSPTDDAHASALLYSENEDQTIVTTSAVLNELANHFSKPPHRTMIAGFIEELHSHPQFRVVHVTVRLFNAGFGLYKRRPDKEWSLTDCISFECMSEFDLRDALTLDRHFSQAGFNVLLAAQ